MTGGIRERARHMKSAVKRFERRPENKMSKFSFWASEEKGTPKKLNDYKSLISFCYGR